MAWIGDADCVATRQSLGQMVCGGVVAVAEASRENENACFVHVALYSEGSDAQALRRCSFRVRLKKKGCLKIKTERMHMMEFVL